VGAPRAAYNTYINRNDSTPGKVYKCEFKGKCDELKLQEKGNCSAGPTQPLRYEVNDRAMLGSTLDVYDNTILVILFSV
jgi:hypothetical protein